MSSPSSFKEAKREEDGFSLTNVSSSVFQPVSETSTMTRTDVPGAGRTIGIIFARGGRRVEHYIGQIACSLGFGPHAVAQSILTRLTQAGMHYFSTLFPNVAIENEAYLGCEKLLQFVRENIPVNQQSAIKCIIVLISTLPILQKFFDSPHAMLAFDTGRKLPSFRAGNDSIPVHSRNLETLMKCLALFTRDSVVQAIVEKHRARTKNGEQGERTSALSLITHLCPYFRHPFLHLPAIQHSRMIVLQILLKGTDRESSPKVLFDTFYEMKFDAIGCFSSTSLAAIPTQTRESSSIIGDNYQHCWEGLCNIILSREGDSKNHVDHRGVDKLLEMILFTLDQELRIDWASHKITLNTVLHFSRLRREVYPSAHKTALSMVKGLNESMRPLDELTRTISDHCLRHRSVLMYTLIGSKDGEKKWMKRDEELDKRCEEVQLYLRSGGKRVEADVLDGIVFLIAQYPFLCSYFTDSFLKQSKRLRSEAYEVFSDSGSLIYTVRKIMQQLVTGQSGSTKVLYDLLSHISQAKNSSLAIIGFTLSALSWQIELAAAVQRTPCEPPQCRCYFHAVDVSEFSWESLCTVTVRLITMWEPDLPFVSRRWHARLDVVLVQVLEQMTQTCGYRNTITKGEIPPDQLVELLRSVMSLPEDVFDSRFPRSKAQVQKMVKKIMDVEPTIDVLTWEWMYYR